MIRGKSRLNIFRCFPQSLQKTWEEKSIEIDTTSWTCVICRNLSLKVQNQNFKLGKKVPLRCEAILNRFSQEIDWPALSLGSIAF